ncbi:MAG TPA: hypothetical protein VLW85_21550 [Myxococcales bacterium]|nr:hypothetical protein [Myxococcales bacterium]
MRHAAVALAFALACSHRAATPSDAGDAGDIGDAGDAGGAGDAGDGGPCTTGSAGIAGAGGIFEENEPWTKDVSGALKDCRSDAIIAALGQQGGWGNGNNLQIDFAIPLFFADGGTPRQVVNGVSGYCYNGPDCDPVPFTMPMPAGGNMEGSSTYTCNTHSNDCHLLVVETQEQKLYELYNATQVGGGGFTALGAFKWDLTKAYPDNLRGDQCTSADAAGFPIAALLPTADEVASGAVNHALRFILPNARMKADVYVHPATHAGSPSSANANAPPYGVRFRLKASFDDSAYDAAEKVIIHAMKKYGMLLSDGGNIALTFADDRTSASKWAALGIDSHSFNSIGVSNFEVVDLTPEIALTDDCVRNP